MMDLYELPEGFDSPSSLRNFGEGLLFALATAVDGYFKGDVAAKQANNEAERHRAEVDRDNRELDITHNLGWLDYLHKGKALSEEGPQLSQP